MKTLFVMAIIAMFGGEMGMWLGATHFNSMSFSNAGFVVYVIAFFATILFGTLACAEDCPKIA